MPDTSDAPHHSKGKPSRNAVGLPEPERQQPVQPTAPEKPVGERQDGPGTAPSRPDRSEATPIGATAMRRRGDSRAR